MVDEEKKPSGELTITFHPKKLVKIFVLILLFVGVFFVGQLTSGFGDSCAADTTAAAVVVAQEEAIAGAAVEAAQPEVVPEVVEEEVILEEETEVEEEKELPEEDIITTYANVALAINAVKTTSYDTWGKITGIDYTVKNNEVGTIVGSYFVLTMVGYNDYFKEIPIPASAATIRSETTAATRATVPQGFAYNEVTVGDLSSVQIAFNMFDASGKLMASSAKVVDLS
jgi:hypothetical protein